MKLANLLLGLTLMIGLNSVAQDDAERECKRMKFLAGEALKVENYKEAAMYYLKGEEICGGYDKNDHTMSDCYVIDGSQSPIGQMLESRRSASSLGKKKVKNHPIAAL